MNEKYSVEFKIYDDGNNVIRRLMGVYDDEDSARKVFTSLELDLLTEYPNNERFGELLRLVPISQVIYKCEVLNPSKNKMP